MSTQTSERVDSIAHLTFTPECAIKVEGCTDAAEYWTDWHGHDDAVACSACVASERRHFESCREDDGLVECGECLKRFATFEQGMSVVPL
ncbi:hypothetical protein [Nocardia farcinica]|uniref:hypothetical protein n=1 Tax=Nocardia farcinica TaxID=37329 RepID=UPI00245758D9|nr:hypothetical protein [Nocardia farcinica]